MEKIFAWFKVNYPEYELMYACDSLIGNHIFYIRKIAPGALMFKKIISAADIRSSINPDEFIMDTLKGIIENMEE